MQLQWLVLVLIGLALAVDNRILWPNFARRVAHHPAQARRALWAQWMVMLWGCSALVMGLWIARGLPASALGLEMPTGWRLWGPAVPIVAFVAVQLGVATRIARLTGDKTKLRSQIGSTGLVMPHEAAELAAWVGLSLSAGFCEELLFRGFLIWILQPFAGWWGAAIASLAIFALAHTYQGREGLLRSALVGALLTAIVFVAHSLWPAIVLHAALDLIGGWIGWLVLREPAAPLPATAPAGPR